MKERKTWTLIVGVLIVIMVAGALLASCQTPIAPQPPTPERAQLERIGIFCRDADADCITIYNGADINVYTNEGTTLSFGVEGAQGLVKVAAPSGVGTATPVVILESNSASNVLEIRNATGTPVIQFLKSGAAVFVGSITSAGGTLSGGPVKITGPTAAVTATPVFRIDNAADVNDLLVVEKDATPVFSIRNGGEVVATGALTAVGITVGVDATGADVTFYSATAGDNFLWDASEEALILTGTNAQTALNVADGNVVVNDNLTVTAGAFDVTAGATTVEALTVGADAAGADVTFHSATAGDYFLWDASEEKLILTGTNAQTALDVADGNAVVNDNLTVTAGAFDVTAGATTVEILTVGADAAGADVTFHSATAGDYFLWDASEEALILTGTNGQTALSVADGNLAVTDNATVGGTLGITGATTAAADVTITALADGNNAGEKNEYIGLPRIKLVGLGGGTNPGSQTVALIDANPTGEWVEVDAGTNLAVTADTSYYRDVTNSVKLAFTDVVDNDGVDGTIAQVDLGDMESLGFWIYSSVAISSGDFDVTLDDTNGTDQVYSVGGVAANTWTWVELDISACGANCDTTDGIQFLATTQGGTTHTAANIYIDAMYVWDAVDEEALGLAIQRDGVLGVVNAVNGAGLVEWTDYIVHYEATVDFLVWVTDQSTAFAMALVAY